MMLVGPLLPGNDFTGFPLVDEIETHAVKDENDDFDGNQVVAARFRVEKCPFRASFGHKVGPKALQKDLISGFWHRGRGHVRPQGLGGRDVHRC